MDRSACTRAGTTAGETGGAARCGARGAAWRWLGVTLSACLATVVAGCTISSSYMGLSLAPGAVSTDVQALALRASQGDKLAALELGKRFEAGDGVPRDRVRAIRLYRVAASDSGGTLWVYAPSPGGSASGRVIPVDRGPRVAGLAEARRKLQELQQGRETR